MLVNSFVFGGSPPAAPAAPTNARPQSWMGNNSVLFDTPALPAGTTDTDFTLQFREDSGSWNDVPSIPPSTSDNNTGEVAPPPFGPLADDLVTMSQTPSLLELRLKGCSNAFGTGPVSPSVFCLLPPAAPFNINNHLLAQTVDFDTPAMASGAIDVQFELFYNADGAGWTDSGLQYNPSSATQNFDYSGLGVTLSLSLRFAPVTNGFVNSPDGWDANVPLI